MCPPVGSPLKLKLMSMYLPKRLELSLRFVLAFPKASSTQLDLSSTFFTLDPSQQNRWWKHVRNSHHKDMRMCEQIKVRRFIGLSFSHDPVTYLCRMSRQKPSGFISVAAHLSTSSLWLGFVMAAMYCMMYLLASVFPAPLSPDTQCRQFESQIITIHI